MAFANNINEWLNFHRCGDFTNRASEFRPIPDVIALCTSHASPYPTGADWDLEMDEHPIKREVRGQIGRLLATVIKILQH